MGDCHSLNIDEPDHNVRYVNPNDLILPPGYAAEVYAQGLDFPINMVFIENSDILIGESGYFNGFPRIIRISSGQIDVIAEDFFLH